MFEPNSSETSSAKNEIKGPAPICDAQSIESLPSHARKALWHLRKWLQVKARFPVFALVGSDSFELTNTALALCAAEGGYYIRLSEYIGQQMLADPNFREEWITGYYLAQTVMDLVNNCQASFLVVDDWEVVLGLVRHTNSIAHLITLSMLANRPLQKPVVLVLPIGHSSFGNADEVRHELEIGGSSRVVTLVEGSDQENEG
jgi:hypothetical protein